MSRLCTHYERLLVDILHVQGHQVLAAAQVEAALVLVHMEDAVVAGVEGEAEGTSGSCVHQFCAGGQKNKYKKKHLLKLVNLPQERGRSIELLHKWIQFLEV